jgi:hypothetical protein
MPARRREARLRPIMLWEFIEDDCKRQDINFLAEYMLRIVPSCLDASEHTKECADDGARTPTSTTVHNMVSTSMLLCSEMPINLSLLAMLLPCSTYDRRRFAAITIRLENPRCTALLFTSGKLVITGVKSW